jgi:hypothetical protein
MIRGRGEVSDNEKKENRSYRWGTLVSPFAVMTHMLRFFNFLDSISCPVFSRNANPVEIPKIRKKKRSKNLS